MTGYDARLRDLRVREMRAPRDVPVSWRGVEMPDWAGLRTSLKRVAAAVDTAGQCDGLPGGGPDPFADVDTPWTPPTAPHAWPFTDRDLLAAASSVTAVEAPPLRDVQARKPRPRLDIPYIVRTGERVAYIDLDGVVCDDRHRVHHAQARDWGDYFAKMTDDVPWRQGRDLYESAIMTGWDVAYLTGRREDTRGWTVEWLKRHDYDHTLPLVMRPEGQRMPLANLKALIVEETLRFVPEVILYDDDPEVIKAVSQVAGAQAVHCTWHKKEKSLIKKAQF